MANLVARVLEQSSNYNAYTRPPRFTIIAGANGSGKSTNASAFLPDDIVYINADEIAKALPVEISGRRDMEASRLLLAKWDEFADGREHFAIETTLSSRSLAPRIHRLVEQSYEFHLLFFWLESADLAVSRVAERIRQGGHNIPEQVIRRRYTAGIENFFALYLPLAATWRVFDNSVWGATKLIARGERSEGVTVVEPGVWSGIQGAHRGR